MRHWLSFEQHFILCVEVLQNGLVSYHLGKGLFFLQERVGRVSFQVFLSIVVDLDSLEVFVHVVANELLEPEVLLFDSLKFMRDGLVFFLLKLHETLLKLLSVFELSLDKLGVRADNIFDFLL